MNKFTRLFVDILMILFFLSLLAFPFSAIGLFNPADVSFSKVEVLGQRSTQDSRQVPQSSEVKGFTVKSTDYSNAHLRPRAGDISDVWDASEASESTSTVKSD